MDIIKEIEKDLFIETKDLFLQVQNIKYKDK